MKLLDKHFGMINRTSCEDGLFDEMRELYKDNPEALQQIDECDPESEYNVELREKREEYCKERKIYYGT